MNPAYFYDIRMPSRLEPGTTYPTIFALHGKGSDEKDILGLTAPLSGDFILVGIRGNLAMGAGYQYYELKSLGNPIRDQFDQAALQLEAFIAYATEKYPVDPRRRYMLGFSQGAILAMTLALTMGDRLKGIVAMNGYIPDFVKTEYPLRSVRDLSVFLSNGEHDPVFPLSIGQVTAAYFRGLGTRLTFAAYPTGHGVSEDNRRDVVHWLEQDAGLINPKE